MTRDFLEPSFLPWVQLVVSFSPLRRLRITWEETRNNKGKTLIQSLHWPVERLIGKGKKRQVRNVRRSQSNTLGTVKTMSWVVK